MTLSDKGNQDLERLIKNYVELPEGKVFKLDDLENAVKLLFT